MKIEITKGQNPVADYFATALSAEGEAERLQLKFADKLVALMAEQGVSRTEFARRLGIQPSRVTALLSGNGNLTIRTMVRAARALGAQYHNCLAPETHSVRWQCWDEADVHPDFRVKPAAPKSAAATFRLAPTNEDDKAAAA